MSKIPVKIPYVTPLVFQTVDIFLEQDLLQGPSSMGAVMATGHEVEKNDDFVNTTWD